VNYHFQEFIYKPSPDIAENFEHTLEQMQHRGILVIDRKNQGLFIYLFLCLLFVLSCNPQYAQ
jgi:hypothetical protein